MHRGACVALLSILLATGCSAIPDVVQEPQFHNPFPQLYQVAILPFYNLGKDPTLSGEQVSLAYYNELQAIPGFEVMPLGVVQTKLAAIGMDPAGISEATDFQQIARHLGVDVVIRGAITEYSAYYPPRIGLRVDWFAANPGFHRIPVGYGLPWGTAEEEYIPDGLVHEAEFELARSQLATQTPDFRNPSPAPGPPRTDKPRQEQPIDPNALPAPPWANPDRGGEGGGARVESTAYDSRASGGPTMAGPAQGAQAPELPADWPDPRGFIPQGPSPERPRLNPQVGPVITHTRIYHGNDEKLTQRLSEYFYFRDDARFGGWQAYLQRSEDFIRFCCYLHITETLAARGGAGKSRVVWRWPIDRYER